MLDVGCGRGVWLAQGSQHGATDVLGVDGPYIDATTLHVPASSFLAGDISQPLSLGRTFDLVQMLEVAEHLPKANVETFIDNLTRHGSAILFSAAIPGQGGEYHVNEQPWDTGARNSPPAVSSFFDFVRPLIRDDELIYFCYRFNSFFFANRSIVPSLPERVRASHVAAGEPIRGRYSVLDETPNGRRPSPSGTRREFDRETEIPYQVSKYGRAHSLTPVRVAATSGRCQS